MHGLEVRRLSAQVVFQAETVKIPSLQDTTHIHRELDI